MSNVNILRRQVKKFVDNAEEKELLMIYRMFEVAQETDWWDEIDEGEKTSIRKGLKQLDQGKGIPHEEVVKKYKKWFTK
jgi:predicted transcriptional regulator